MAEANAKQRVIEAVQRLPEDATVEDAMERLYFLAKIDRGLDDAKAGRSLPHEEIRRRFVK
jgi:predicted transcriptional regulator